MRVPITTFICTYLHLFTFFYRHIHLFTFIYVLLQKYALIYFYIHFPFTVVINGIPQLTRKRGNFAPLGYSVLGEFKNNVKDTDSSSDSQVIPDSESSANELDEKLAEIPVSVKINKRKKRIPKSAEEIENNKKKVKLCVLLY